MITTKTGLPFYDAYSSIRNSTPKESYYQDFLAIAQQTFDNADNVFYNEIQVEETYGSNTFQPINMVRVDSVINFTTGIALGDDYKTFIFMPDYPKPYYGQKYKWNNDYWLVVNTNNDGSLSVSAEMRRCNNVLRFFDENGNKIYEPCIMDYELRFTNNNETPPITIGNKEQKIWCQKNARTESIKPNDKFLFGTPNQRVAIRVYAGGIKNFLNDTTEDDNSPSLTEFYLEDYQISEELDDLVNGFANAYVNNFSVQLNSDETQYNTNIDSQLTATVYKNGNAINVPVVWSSSDETVATVDSTGLVHTISEGQTTISVGMKDNTTISDSVTITVSNAVTPDSYEIRIMPNIDYILQDNSTTFTCYLYKNGIQQTDAFTFKDVSVGVPKSNYIINVINENTFSVTNNQKYLNAPVIVECTSGDYSTNYTITLRGLY